MRKLLLGLGICSIFLWTNCFAALVNISLYRELGASTAVGGAVDSVWTSSAGTEPWNNERMIAGAGETASGEASQTSSFYQNGYLQLNLSGTNQSIADPESRAYAYSHATLSFTVTEEPIDYSLSVSTNLVSGYGYTHAVIYRAVSIDGSGSSSGTLGIGDHSFYFFSATEENGTSYISQSDFSANLSIGSPVPVPGAVWLLGSGLIGLVERSRYAAEKIKMV